MRTLRRVWLGLCSAWLLACASADDNDPPHVHVEPLIPAVRPVPGSSSDLPMFGANDRIEHHDSASGFFRVHYTRSGQHAVPTLDTRGDRVPDYVNKVAGDFDEVLLFYKGLGYREPTRDTDVPGEHGGDDRFDVYLLNFPNAGADGQFRPDSGCAAERCGGYMLLENDFATKGYSSTDIAIRLVSSHELFHAIQYAYATDLSGSLSEGTAVWASEAFDAEAGDLERQAPPFLERPESSLAQDPSGTDPIRYGAALFFEFIDEHAGRDVLRAMWEELASGTAPWTQALDTALRRNSSSLSEQYKTFAQWNLFTAERADPERAYAHGDRLPLVKERSIALGDRADAVRVFPLAARYYALSAERAQRLTAEAALPDDSSVDDLELMIAIEHKGKITSIEHAPHSRARQLSVQLDQGDVGHIVLYNTRIDGGSAQPNLCVGDSPDAVKACESAAKSGESVTPSPAKADSSGGCSIQPGPPAKTSLGVTGALLATMALALRARRKRRAQKTNPEATAPQP